MSLTAEQQAVVDQQNAIEDNRSSNQMVAENKRTKLEALRIAKEVLVENRRTQSAANATDISDSDITNFASVLIEFVNS